MLIAVNIIGQCLIMVTGECGSILSVLGAAMLSLLYAILLCRKDIGSIGLLKHIYSVRVIAYTAIYIRLICESVRLCNGSGSKIAVTGVAVLLCCLYGIKKGFESVTRSVMIFSLPIIISIVMGYLFSIDGSNLRYANYGLKGGNIGDALMASFSFVFVDTVLIGAAQTDKKSSNRLIHTALVGVVLVVLVSIVTVLNVGEEIFGEERLIVLDIISTSTSLSILNQNNGFYYMLWLLAAILSTVSNTSLVTTVSDKRYIYVLFVVLCVLFILLPLDINSLFDIYSGFNVISGVITVLIIPMLMRRRKYEE
jgi:hypothetical protein